jgi:hypothetical protein
MPSGEVHDVHWKIGWFVAVPAALTVCVITSQMPLRNFSSFFTGTGVLAGYALQRYVNPDADLIGVTKGEGMLINHLGIIGGFIFSYFAFYGYVFRKHHRSIWTHGPLIGTAIRYVYLFWWPFREIYWSTHDLAWLVFIFVGMFVGTSLGDVFHWLDDKIA